MKVRAQLFIGGELACHEVAVAIDVPAKGGDANSWEGVLTLPWGFRPPSHGATCKLVMEDGWSGEILIGQAFPQIFLFRIGPPASVYFRGIGPLQAQPGTAATWAVLTTAMLERKGQGYARAIATLQSGGTVQMDTLAFAVGPDGALGLTTVASLPASEMDEDRALQDADRAMERFEVIARVSSEIAALASGKRRRISLMSACGPNGVEVCRVTDGKVAWTVKR
jgi:hypothetical protein